MAGWVASTTTRRSRPCTELAGSRSVAATSLNGPVPSRKRFLSMLQETRTLVAPISGELVATTGLDTVPADPRWRRGLSPSTTSSCSRRTRHPGGPPVPQRSAVPLRAPAELGGHASLRRHRHPPGAALGLVGDHRVRLPLAHRDGPDEDRRRVPRPGPPRPAPSARELARRRMGALRGPGTERERPRHPHRPADAPHDRSGRPSTPTSTASAFPSSDLTRRGRRFGSSASRAGPRATQ